MIQPKCSKPNPSFYIKRSRTIVISGFGSKLLCIQIKANKNRSTPTKIHRFGSKLLYKIRVQNRQNYPNTGPSFYKIQPKCWSRTPPPKKKIWIQTDSDLIFYKHRIRIRPNYPDSMKTVDCSVECPAGGGGAWFLY